MNTTVERPQEFTNNDYRLIGRKNRNTPDQLQGARCESIVHVTAELS